MENIYSSKFSHRSNYISKIFSRVLISVIIFLSSMIFINYSDKNKELYKKEIIDKNINYSKITNLYNKYFGEVLPMNEIDNSQLVFNDKLIYKNIDVFKNGFVLDLGSNHLVPSLQSGLIVYIGEKEDYGNTVIVQGIDGVDIWYGNINLTNYTLYDYISKGELLGESVSDSIYLVFNKDGQHLGYEEYLD